MTIDFEASCLPRHGRSFPIEVGICGPQGVRSWLIRPVAAWDGWDWTHEAYQLHGIRREQLDAEGLAPDTVVAELLEAVGSARVIADSSIDAVWWQTLLAAASPVVRPELRIEHVGAILDELVATDAQIVTAQRSADALSPHRHRAGADAQWLWNFVHALEAEVTADRARGQWPVMQELYPQALPMSRQAV